MRHRLLFLDIDGVLNSTAFALRERTPGVMGIDTNTIPLLHSILERADCDIVLSSTWRYIYGLQETVQMMVHAGFKYPEAVVARTPLIRGVSRGAEVHQWRTLQPHTGPYVCLDDDADFLKGQPLVQTSGYCGLTRVEADACVHMFRSQL